MLGTATDQPKFDVERYFTHLKALLKPDSVNVKKLGLKDSYVIKFPVNLFDSPEFTVPLINIYSPESNLNSDVEISGTVDMHKFPNFVVLKWQPIMDLMMVNAASCHKRAWGEFFVSTENSPHLGELLDQKAKAQAAAQTTAR